MRSTPRRAETVLSDAAAVAVLRQVTAGSPIDHHLLRVELAQLRPGTVRKTMAASSSGGT